MVGCATAQRSGCAPLATVLYVSCRGFLPFVTAWFGRACAWSVFGRGKQTQWTGGYVAYYWLLLAWVEAVVGHAV
jgi:hypothetical protein